tara:strand:+ start:113 stop:367 length:255 start_codon:yes stop_codon:yes gene_type:complete
MSKSRNNALEFSSVGSVIVDLAAGTVTGRFGAIQVLQDCEISSIAGSSVDNISKLETTFPAGTVIYGIFTEIELNSGLVALHKV